MILELLPHKDPFRYLDEILEVTNNNITGRYTYKEDEWFYTGHFPGNPITPGVIMIETMAQTAVVAQGIYLLCFSGSKKKSLKNDVLTLFTDVEAEFFKEIRPGETVTVRGHKVFWRRNKLRSKAELYNENGDLAAAAVLSGIGVIR